MYLSGKSGRGDAHVHTYVHAHTHTHTHTHTHYCQGGSVSLEWADRCVQVLLQKKGECVLFWPSAVVLLYPDASRLAGPTYTQLGVTVSV